MIGRNRVSLHGKRGTYVFSLKDALLNILQQEIKDPQELYVQSQKIGRIIDSFGVATFEALSKGERKSFFVRLTRSEISMPVIRVWDGILALPIIGTLDSAKTQIVMESLLQEIVRPAAALPFSTSLVYLLSIHRRAH